MRTAAVCVLFATSCSWAFVRPPPADHPTAADDCTESRAPPVADLAFTAMAGLTLFVVSGLCYQKSHGTAQDGSPSQPCSTGVYVSLVFTGLLGSTTAVSAVDGFRATGQCRDRRALEAPIAATAR